MMEILLMFLVGIGLLIISLILIILYVVWR